MVFHVDYWDYLGWKDPFSKAQFSVRQRTHKQLGNIKSVYTPGFVVNGKEWKGWFRGKDINLTESEAGVLTFRLRHNKGKKTQFNAQYTQSHPKANQNLQLTVALLGMNNKTKVRAGENRSKELTESFIVLELMTFQASKVEAEIGARPTGNTVLFSDAISIRVKPDALATWVNDKQSLHPIQSTGGYL